MRKVLSGLAVMAMFAATAQASSITPKLVVTADPSNVPGLFDVAIQIQSDGTANPAANGDGGVAVIQFDVLSNGVGLTTPSQQSTSGPNAQRVKTTYNTAVVPTSSFGTETLPLRRDVTAADNQSGAAGTALYVADGDLDAVAGVLADSGLSYGSPQVGVGGFVTIATEVWQLNNPAVGDTLSVFLSGGSYYDFTATATNFLVSYGSNGTATANLPATAPEPATLVLFGMGCLGMIGMKLRHRS